MGYTDTCLHHRTRHFHVLDVLVSSLICNSSAEQFAHNYRFGITKFALFNPLMSLRTDLQAHTPEFTDVHPFLGIANMETFPIAYDIPISMVNSVLYKRRLPDEDR